MFTKKQLLAKDNLHHAYLIEGEYDQVFPELLSYLKEHKLIAGPNDVYQNSSETLTIDLSRLIKVQQAEKSAHKFFILGANFFTREAANSLLKVFEEPTPGTHFFLITPNPHLLPATLRSRLHFISAENKKGIKPEVLEEAKKFLAASHSQRIKIIEEFLKKFEDLEVGENNMKSRALAWLNVIETILHDSGKDTKEKVYEFEELAKVRDYIADRGASAKMLLEHLALILPTIK